MRRALIIMAVLLSFTVIDVRRAKSLVRRFAVALTRALLNLVSRPYRLSEGVTLVLAPHQDDETLGCGGLIARKRNEGLPVHVAFITDGRASHPDHPVYSPDEMAALRRREARRSLAILGVESGAIHFLDEPDGTLNHLTPDRRGELIQRIAGLMTAVQPTRIHLPFHRDGSSEHDAAFDIAREAIALSGVQCELWQYAVWAWWNPLLLLRLPFFPNCRRLPTEDYQLIKSRALANYRSQTEPLAPWTTPALPVELLRIFAGDTEYFFRYPSAARRPATAAPARLSS